MIKKIAKLVLVVLMIIGAFIAVTNVFFDANLQSEGFRVVTYFEDIPDCSGPPSDCNDFTDFTPK